MYSDFPAAKSNTTDVDAPEFCRRPLLAVCALAFALAGCAGNKPPPVPRGASAASQAAEEAANVKPGIVTRALRAVGLAEKPPPKPTQQMLSLRIFTADNLNAGTEREALPLLLKVYRLRSPSRFNQASFDDFLDDDQIRSDLSTTLLGSRQMLLLPGQRYTSTQKLPAEAKYLGLVALFRGPAPHRWRFLYDVSKSGETGITLGVHACALSSTSGALLTDLAEPPNSLASVHCPSPGS